MRLVLLLAPAALMLSSAPTSAQTSSSEGASNPPEETSICTDRPAKANATCTVPEGDLQIESDVINWASASASDASIHTILFTNPTLKYGVLADLDVEVNWAPWAQVSARDDGHTDTRSSVGDLILRAKWRAFDLDVFSAALIPYVKLPTASRPVGDGAVEGGLLLPIAIKLPAGFKLSLQPELDVLENADRTGAHPNEANLVDLSWSRGKWTLYAELWNAQEFEPAGTEAKTTADVAVSWLLTNTTQFDIGGNFGLDRNAPRQQLYLGYSRRF